MEGEVVIKSREGGVDKRCDSSSTYLYHGSLQNSSGCDLGSPLGYGSILVGRKGEEKKMHWVSWAKLCKPKCTGGMSFEDFAVFNDALLVRQVWRLMHYKYSLLSRIVSAKYYPHGDIFIARLGYSNSYYWSSIWSA